MRRWRYRNKACQRRYPMPVRPFAHSQRQFRRAGSGGHQSLVENHDRQITTAAFRYLRLLGLPALRRYDLTETRRPPFNFRLWARTLDITRGGIGRRPRLDRGRQRPLSSAGRKSCGFESRRPHHHNRHLAAFERVACVEREYFNHRRKCKNENRYLSEHQK